MSIRSQLINRDIIKKIDLGFEIKDFGPIREGTIELKPLTIFIGPNNSGKSYVAMLIHSFFESFIPTALLTDMPYRLRSYKYRRYKYGFPGISSFESDDFRGFIKEESSDLKRLIKEHKTEDEIVIPKPLIDKITIKIFNEFYEKRLNNEIIRSFASPLNKLIRIGKRSFALGIYFNSDAINLNYQKEKLEIEKYPQLNMDLRIKMVDKERFVVSANKKNDVYLIEVNRKMVDEAPIGGMVMDELFEICTSKVLEKLAMPCYYLPAARSGILQGHKALAAGIIERAPFVGLKKFEIPKFSGVVSDFISSILTLPQEKGTLYPLAIELEKELLKGEIILRTLEEYAYPEIQYKFLDTEIPLHRSSSTVSELAPFFLYLKYIVEPGSILIIEEPEAHLHPGNQRILAKILVKLIRRNVNIIITTHSEFLLDQLSNFILLSEVEVKNRIEKFQYTEEDFLRSDEISAYVFNYDLKRTGTKIEEVEITEDGISQEEFLKIHESLYEETLKLRKELEK